MLEYSKLVPHTYSHWVRLSSLCVLEIFVLCVCLCVYVYSVCAGCVPSVTSGSLWFFSWTAKWGEKYSQLPSGKLTWCSSLFSLSHTLCCPNSSSFTLFSAEHTRCTHTHSHRNTLVFAFFSISLSFPVRTCMPFVARLRVHKNKNMHMRPGLIFCTCVPA